MMRALFSLWLATQAFAGQVTNATVYTPDGPQKGWGVSWSGDGRIVSVGANVTGESVKGDDLHVTPGFIAPFTQMGVVEISLEDRTREDSWDGDEIRAAFVVVDAYDPLSSVVRISRLGGVTTAIVSPNGGFVSGQAGAVRLAGTTQRDAIVDRSVGLHMGLKYQGSRAAGQVRIAELLEDAAYHRRKGSSYDVSDLSASRLDLAVLAKAGSEDLPIIIGADRASDIESVIRLADQLKLKVILSGGAEAWMHAEALAERDIPVVIDPMVYGPGGVHQIHGRADNAKLLHDAGVKVILSGGGTHNARSLRYAAGNAVRGGLDHTIAVAAITEHPAGAFGLTDRGRLVPGAAADIAVWDGDPLEIGSRLVQLVIDGRSVELTSRQTELVEAYREIGNKPLLPPAP